MEGLCPNGIEFRGSKVFVNCICCNKRIYWMKRDCGLEKHLLPKGWTGGSPCSNFLLCGKCTKNYLKL
jgi:hypothetical protein